MAIQEAVLGGGCFWCLEGIFQQLAGVLEVQSGYSGGVVEYPTYEQVCTGDTGHAEVVCIQFDDEIISYEALLELFFGMHDPTTMNRQGADVGTQYRSAIFYQDETQKHAAEQVIQALEGSQAWPDPIVTQVVALDKFYPAEDYHQDYFNRNPSQRYCQLVIAPKVGKFVKKYKERLSNH